MYLNVASRAGIVTVAALVREEDLRDAVRRSERRQARIDRHALARAQAAATVPEVRRRLGRRLTLRLHRAAAR